MSLQSLAGANCPNGADNIQITGLTADSRKIDAGYLFAAIKGTAVDGADYIDVAKQAGAVAVLTGHEGYAKAKASGLAVIEAENPRASLAHMAASFYAPQPKHVVAVTGTNGKTSVADFVRQIWTLMNVPAASVGTLGAIGPNGAIDLGHTTPDPVHLHQALQDLAQAGVDHVALEASSHGLDQYRLDGVRVQHAAFTNISRDHLDYHHTFENYFNAKRRLVTDLLQQGGSLVLNEWRQDRAIAAALVDDATAHGAQLIRVGGVQSELALLTHELTPGGQRLSVRYEGSSYDIDMPLIGDFQAANILVAAGLVIAAGGAAAQVMQVLPLLQGVPGRMESVGPGVVVDYAHTPDGLATALRAARAHTEGKLIVVFGCGGDRDKGKRPQMGALAAELADHVIVTDDNPRSENADAIRAEIMSACPDAENIGDRADAIAKAINLRGADDLVLIAGKGHETGQIIGQQTLPFDDRAVARELIGGHNG